MPAQRFTRKANTKAKRRQWSHVEQSMLARGKSKAAAIKAANSVVKNHPSQKKS